MLKKYADKLRGSLAARVFLLTAPALSALCGLSALALGADREAVLRALPLLIAAVAALSGLAAFLCARCVEGPRDRLRAALAEDEAELERRREAERRRSGFCAAASRQLKAPAAALKGQLAGIVAGSDAYRDRDRALARALAGAGRMEKLIQEIFTVSQLERDDVVLRWETVDLSALVDRQIALAEELALQKYQALAAGIAAGLQVRGDRALLERAVGSLLVNALVYSPACETVAVRLTAGADGPVLRVENDGVAISEKDLPHLFEPFYRGRRAPGRAAGGAGLGLYLVRLILDRHGGSCKIENTESGVRATVRFTAAVPAARRTPGPSPRPPASAASRRG